MNSKPEHRLGVVVIGRNEGQRLEACFDSIAAIPASTVYVDSQSTDQSPQIARSRGIDVVQLHDDEPLTAARSRNAGFRRLLSNAPDVDLIQFIDGDCTLVPGWIDHAVAAMDADPTLGVVCGRRRERFPRHSIYNQLCDMEWDTPIGPAASCGGDALMLVQAVESVGGFDASLIAGEEPELCLRLRMNCWGVSRIDCEMTLHDARMSRFAQWWKRTMRSGHAYAEGHARHGRSPQRYCARQVSSIVLWAVIVPLMAIGLDWVTHGWSLAIFLLYPVLAVRISIGQRRTKRDITPVAAARYSLFCVLGKFAQAQGMFQFWTNRLRGRRTPLIEYQNAAKVHSPMAISDGSGGEA